MSWDDDDTDIFGATVEGATWGPIGWWTIIFLFVVVGVLQPPSARIRSAAPLFIPTRSPNVEVPDEQPNPCAGDERRKATEHAGEHGSRPRVER